MRNSKIFILEDNLFYANLILNRLEELGYGNVETFSNAEEMMVVIHQQPLFAFLDHNLPDGKGLDVLKDIKGTYPNINCIMLSGQATISVAIDSLKYGAFDYLLKGKDDSLERIEKVLNDCFRMTRHDTQQTKSKFLNSFLNIF